NLTHRTNKLGKWTIDHTHTLSLRETDLRFGFLSFLSDLLENGPHLMLLQRDGACARTYKACDTRRVTNNIPCFVAHHHLNKNIPGEYLALYSASLPLLDLHLFLCRNNDTKNLVPHIHRGNACFEVALDFIFIT